MTSPFQTCQWVTLSSLIQWVQHKQIRILVKLFVFLFFFNSKHLSIYLYICIFYVVELLEEIPLPGEFMTRQCMETTLPRYFSWTINESLGIVYCQSYTNLNQTCFIKTVRFDTTDKVSFLLNGKKFHHKE
jgi:hypothetical protein